MYDNDSFYGFECKELSEMVRRYKKNTLIQVEWVDIVENSAWVEEEKIKRPDCDCKSAGYFLKIDKEFLYLSSTISKKERNVLTIPLGCVKKVSKCH